MAFRFGALTVTAVIVVGGSVAGCASEGPPPTEEMTRAQTLINEADKAGVQRYAAADLQRAHDELSDAQKANGDGKYMEARRYAESAAADADLATARAAEGTEVQAAHEVVQANETLRQESSRATAGGAATSN